VFEKLGSFSFTRRWWILAAAVAGVAFAVVWGTGVFGVLVGAGFDDPDSDSFLAKERAAEAIGRDASDLLVLYTSESLSVEDPSYRSAVESALADLPDTVVSNVTTYWSSGSPDLVSEDKSATFAVLTLVGATEDDRVDAYEEIRPELVSPVEGLRVEVGGPAALVFDINTQVREDIARAEAISIPVVLVLLVIVFGGLVAASLPLVIGGLAVLGSFTMLRLLSLFTDVSVFSINVVTMLGLGLAIDYALFIVSRYREELQVAADPRRALVVAMSTAGRTVAFSGVTVAISLASLLFFPQVFLRSMAFGGISAVLIAMLGALTVLPALLAVIGLRIDRLRVPLGRTTVARHRLPRPGTWHRVGRAVMRRPVVYVAAIVPLLLVLGTPFLGVKFGPGDHRVLPVGNESRVVAERLARDFTGGGQDPIDAVVTLPSPVSSTGPALEAYRAELSALPDVVSADVAGAAGSTVRIAVSHGLSNQSDEAKDLVAAIRAVPDPDGGEALVGGPTAELVDILASFSAKLPWMVGWMVGSTLLLLFLAFGSVVLPIKAVVMNTLSLTASFGALVWIFQDGHLSGPLDFTVTGWVDSAQPILILAIAFGLSMDYEVFLLSRIREEWERTGDNATSVATGLQRTGGIITSAALILAIVFAAFATSGITFIKMIGVGMVIAIAIDATVVRTLLVPASMQLLGRANWWAPAPLLTFWQRYGWREGASSPRLPRSRMSAHPHRQARPARPQPAPESTGS